MVRVALYILVCSGRNRLRRRLQRLREPRYLLGAIVGSAYLYFSLFGRLQAARAGSRRGRVVTPWLALLPLAGGRGPAIASLGMLAFAAASVLMPFSSGLLAFTQAETEFLFPMPVSRRELLVYRLFRSQWGIFFSALILSLTITIATPAARARGFFGVWLMLMTMRVFFSGVALTRMTTARGDIWALAMKWLPRIVVWGALLVVLGTAWRLVTVEGLPINTARDVVALIAAMGSNRLVLFALTPFAAVIRPLFAESTVAFLAALVPALGVYALTTAWVLTADAAFEALQDSLVEAGERKPRRRGRTYRARPMRWTLALTGRPETPFAWKAATQTLRIVGRGFFVRVFLIVLWIVVALLIVSARARGVVQAVGIMTAFMAAFAVVIGPQMVRFDMRQDLQHLELLKTWPVKPGSLIRGEILWPAALVTAVSWTLGVVALTLSSAAFARTGLSLRLAGGWAAMIVAPSLILAQFTIQNAVAVLFPAWIQSGGGAGRPRGVDAMGQRLIMLAGTWITLIVAVVPGAIIGGVLWLAFYRWVGPWILLPSAVIATALILLEVLMATEAIGAAYERLDVTSVEREET